MSAEASGKASSEAKKPLSLVFYTCFYGSNKNPAFCIPSLPTTDYKCYYYTNNAEMIEKIKGTGWIGIFDDNQLTDDVFYTAWASKKPKALPHTYAELKDYDYTVYLDSKLGKVRMDVVQELIRKYLVEQNYALLMREHWEVKNSIWNEYGLSVYVHERYRLESERYRRYIHRQLSTGLKEQIPDHCATGFIIRNMRHPKTAQIGQTWYDHIQECGIQCQISFFFVRQLFEGCVYAFKEYPYY